MSKKSDEFEKKIARIKKVIESNDAEIIWNDKMPDPDNPEQPRQIDIFIKKNGKVTHVECRIHKSPQDVKWVEELIGRKISLGVNSMIGVSASGFTKGALLKAQSKGIILRDFNQVSIEEAKSWGEITEIDITWLLFMDLKLNFILAENLNKTITEEEILYWIGDNQKTVYEIIEKTANDYPQPEDPNDKVKRTIRNEFTLIDNSNSLGIKKIALISDIEYLRKPEEVISFYSYGDPREVDVTKRTTVEENDTESIELINSTNQIGITLDLSKVVRPINSIFKAVGWKVKRPSKGIRVNLISTFDRKFTFKNLKIEITNE